MLSARASAAAVPTTTLDRAALARRAAVADQAVAADKVREPAAASSELPRLARADMSPSVGAPERPAGVEALIFWAAGLAPKLWSRQLWPQKPWQRRGTFAPD